MNRTAAQIIAEQKHTPIYLTNGTLDSLLDDTPTLGEEVFKKLGLSYRINKGPTTPTIGSGEAAGFFPFTLEEDVYLTEDSADAVYGGAQMSYTILYKGKKYFAPAVDVCFDGPNRPFSVGSYGSFTGAIYNTEADALREAKRLAKFLRPKMQEFGGNVYVYQEAESDRHQVLLLFPPASVVTTFKSAGPHSRLSMYTMFVASLFKGYKARPANKVSKVPA
jgi:hypothetical protein